MVHRERRDWGQEREIPTMATCFKEKGEISLLRNPKIKTISFPQNQNPKLRWERSKRSEMPFSRNLWLSHTMAIDSSNQLNFNPTTTTEENSKQTLDDDTTLTSVSSLQLHVNIGQNSKFNSPFSNSLYSVSYKRKNKKNLENLKTLFVLYNNRWFRCYPIPSLQRLQFKKQNIILFPNLYIVW